MRDSPLGLDRTILISADGERVFRIPKRAGHCVQSTNKDVRFLH